MLYCGDGGGDEIAGARRAGMIAVLGGHGAVTYHRADENGLGICC